MKKHLALVLALVMALSSFSFVSAAPDFADVEGTVYEDAVDRLELLNVLKGYPDGTFKPEDSITRAEFATVAVRARGLDEVAKAAAGLPSGFTDVPAGHWAAGYVGTAGSMGIVNGIGNGLFAPEAPVKYEEAVTMLVRALGYEYEAQLKGGYPFGYLIVAEDIDLLDGARGNQGTWATRGLVALLADNALEIPMMIQDGTGDWVVSGEDRTEEQYLLDFMGFDAVEGVVEVKDMADMEIEVGGDDYIAPAGFDFFVTEGAEIKAWVDGDDIIVYTINDEILFGAVDANSDLDEIEMVKSEDDYEVAEDVVVKDADFAKVVINSDNEVSFFEGYDLDGFILVEEIDDELILDMNDDEVDVEDFVVLKGDETVSVDDLVEGDVVYFVDGNVLGGEYDGLAVAYNESVVGEIDRVYKATRSFRLDGENYALAEYPETGAMYLDEVGLSEIATDVEEIEWMMDEEVEVEAFLDFNGDVVLVVGDTGEAATSKYYAVLVDEGVVYDGRGGDMLALDLLNEFGEKMELDLTDKMIDDGDFSGKSGSLEITTATAIRTDLAGKFDMVDNAPFLFEVEVDSDGDLETLTLLEVKELVHKDDATKDGFEIDDTYAEVAGVDSRLMSSTVVFYDYDTNNYDFEEVITLGEADDEFSEVEKGFAFVKNGRVEVALATVTDADTDTTDYTGLVENVRTLRSDEEEITIMVGGEEMEFVTSFDGPTGVDDGYFWTLTVGDTSLEIDKVTKAAIEAEMTVKAVDVSEKTITFTDNSVIELLDDAVVYEYEDADEDGTEYSDYDEVSLRDVKKDAKVQYVLARTNSDRWVSYVIVNLSAAPTAKDTMTYTTSGAIELAGLTKDTGYTVRVVTSRDSKILGDFGMTTDANGEGSVMPTGLTAGISYVAELYYTADLVQTSPVRLDAISFTAVVSGS